MLFISMIAPFGSVTGNTVGRWINIFLKVSGINTTEFSAHSTQSAASSLAIAQELSTGTVLQANHCASQTTFSHFYNRRVETTFPTTATTPDLT
jgi:hypothetical protein